ncbi:alpha/beta-hydrolase, partial [Zopfia rhizophila CBS 207.26]
LYYPPGHSASLSARATPILVNWHGSGFIFPLLGSDSLFCARVARDTGLLVLDADYRKAPETPFPGPLHDVEDALRWVATQPKRFDLTRVAVSGFSAGGNLALVAASALKRTLVDLTIPVVVAIYPVTDLSIKPEAKTVPNPRKPTSPHIANLFNDCYAPDKAIRTDPRVSPSLADPADFPPTVAILTCEGDNLAPEANALADKLGDGQRKVVNRTLKAVHHGFDKGAKKGTNEWDQREKAYTLTVKTLKEALNL